MAPEGVNTTIVAVTGQPSSAIARSISPGCYKDQNDLDLM